MIYYVARILKHCTQRVLEKWWMVLSWCLHHTITEDLGAHIVLLMYLCSYCLSQYCRKLSIERKQINYFLPKLIFPMQCGCSESNLLEM